MKNLFLMCFALIFLGCSGKSTKNIQTASIRINQLGYYPVANKIAIVQNGGGKSFKVVNQLDNSVAFSGTLSDTIPYKPSGERVSKADFSELKEAGTYRVVVDGLGESVPFVISNTAYKPAAIASLRTFYYQRCSYELKPEFAGIYSRPAGHPDLAIPFDSAVGKTGTLSSPGGWYDAGDYGKYVVNAGISVGSLLSFYENFSSYFPDKSTFIPESGNGKNDLLDEVKVELDWLKTMQDVDGGVFFKLTARGFCGNLTPEADKDDVRYIMGKSTASTLDFAAVMAMAGRIYASYDAAYAADCLARSEKAWAYAVSKPINCFKNPKGVITGEYGDNTTNDDFSWAASELFITSNKDIYKKYLTDNADSITYTAIAEWANVRALGAFSLATKGANLDSTLRNKVKASIVDAANKQLVEINASGYRVADINFNWGSNSNVAYQGITMVYAWLLTNDMKYMKGASESLDYLLGKNSMNKCFMTGFGTNSVMNPHHRPSSADSITNPIPGFLAGGPNRGRQDNKKLYESPEEAKSYADNAESYASNEVAINWNSPLTVLLAAIDYSMGGNLPVDFKVPTKK